MTCPCDRCDGVGVIYAHIPLTWGEGGKPAGHVTQRVPCPECDGTGAMSPEQELLAMMAARERCQLCGFRAETCGNLPRPCCEDCTHGRDDAGAPEAVA